MAFVNGSLVTEFILLGLSDLLDFQVPVFLVFRLMYMITALWNLTIFIVLNSCLHTPMYFFLLNSSFVGFCYSSVIIPKILMNFVITKNLISYVGCMTQFFLFCFCVISECYILTSMAYDRYVATCNPLLYNIVLSPKMGSYLMLGSYLMGFSSAMIHTGCVLRLAFCDGNTINHYFCDLLPLLQLSCTSTYVNEIEMLIVAGKDIIVPPVIIFISYGFILSSILQMKSTDGMSRAFSTCSSHIIAVSLFFGSGAFMCLKLHSAGTMNNGKTSSIIFTILILMMNPLIYSLRNKDAKVALRKTLRKKIL